MRTLGEFAALPPADLSSRLGQQRAGLAGDRAGRGHGAARADAPRRAVRIVARSGMADGGPRTAVVRADAAARAAVGAPRAPRSGRRGPASRAAARHPFARADAVSADRYARHLQLPSPIRDVRALRTLLLLDLESHPPPAAVDRVTIFIDPTPGRDRAAHVVHTRASDARAAVDAARASRRLDGAGPHRRARDRRFASSWRVPDGAVRDRSRRLRSAHRTELRRGKPSPQLQGPSPESPAPGFGASSLPPAGAGARGDRGRPPHACHDGSPRLCGRTRADGGWSMADFGGLVGRWGRRAVGQEGQAGQVRAGGRRVQTLRPDGHAMSCVLGPRRVGRRAR